MQDNNQNLTVSDFNYSMSLVDNKINVLYQLCRYISDKLETNSEILKKLVAADELSDNFWNVSFLACLASLFRSE